MMEDATVLEIFTQTILFSTKIVVWFLAFFGPIILAGGSVILLIGYIASRIAAGQENR